MTASASTDDRANGETVSGLEGGTWEGEQRLDRHATDLSHKWKATRGSTHMGAGAVRPAAGREPRRVRPERRKPRARSRERCLSPKVRRLRLVIGPAGRGSGLR